MKRLSMIMAILEKDLFDSFKNRMVFFSIFTPILLSVIFRMALSQGDRPRLKLAIVDKGRSEFRRFLDRTPFKPFDVIDVGSVKEARKKVEDGDVSAAVVLPKDFDARIDTDRTAKVDFIVDSLKMSRALPMEYMINKLIHLYRNKPLPIEMKMKFVRGVAFKPEALVLPTWMLFTILGGFMVVTGSIIEEREKKTLQAVLVTPAGLPEVLLGKGLLGFILTFLGAMIILGLNNGLIGNVPVLICLVLAGIFFFSVMGVLLGIVLPGHTTANTFGSFIYMGMFLPVVMSEVNNSVKSVARLLPSWYIDDGIKKVMFSGAGFNELGMHFAYLILAGIVLFGISVIVLKNKESI